MVEAVHTRLSKHNAEMLISGIQAGKTYEQIGASYVPPVSGSCAYKHAKKMGLVDQHPKHGKGSRPYSRNSYWSINRP